MEHVSQCDREAAMRPEVARGYTQRTKAKVLRGDKDEDELVQAFAAHRLAAIAPYREALERIMKVRVDRDDNIWAGADKCRRIAEEALTNMEQPK